MGELHESSIVKNVIFIDRPEPFIADSVAAVSRDWTIIVRGSAPALARETTSISYFSFGPYSFQFAMA
jgi:hypothetical protein